MPTQQLQRQKKALFLETFKRTGNVAASARAARVDRSTYYRWCEHDDTFAAAARAAVQEAADILEATAWQRAVQGIKRERGVYHNGARVDTEVVTEYSDTLLIFLLKGARPEKFRERYDIRRDADAPPLAPLAVTIIEVADRTEEG